MTGRRAALHRWRRHAGERGFTVIEMIITMAILTIVAGAIAAASVVGFRVVGHGGPGDRLTGAHDQMTVEQELSRDVSRAACISKPGSSTYGTCSKVPQSDCSALAGAFLCLAWPEATGCHVAVYKQDSTTHRASRQEYLGAGLVSSYNVTTGPMVTLDPVLTPAASPTVSAFATVNGSTVTLAGGITPPTAGEPVTVSGGNGPQVVTVTSVLDSTFEVNGSVASGDVVATWPSWVSTVSLAVTPTVQSPGVALANPPTGRLVLHPLVGDAAGQQGGAAGSPC